jgi:hypothetical protein
MKLQGAWHRVVAAQKNEHPIKAEKIPGILILPRTSRTNTNLCFDGFRSYPLPFVVFVWFVVKFLRLK